MLKDKNLRHIDLIDDTRIAQSLQPDIDNIVFGLPFVARCEYRGVYHPGFEALDKRFNIPAGCTYRAPYVVTAIAGICPPYHTLKGKSCFRNLSDRRDPFLVSHPI